MTERVSVKTDSRTDDRNYQISCRTARGDQDATRGGRHYPESVDSEYHEHFDVPHNHSSATNVLGSVYLKTLMETYYDLRSGASIAKYKQVEDVIAVFGKGEKDCFFDIRKYARNLQQVKGAQIHKRTK